MTKENSISPNELELVTRRELAGILKKGISSIDLIPEDKLPRVRLGKSVRFTFDSIKSYIDCNKTIPPPKKILNPKREGSNVRR